MKDNTVKYCDVPEPSGTEQKNCQFDDLIAAVSANDVEKVKRLIKAGVDVNMPHKMDLEHHYTALMAAAQHGQTENVKLLLAAGADVNAQAKFRNTALMYGAEQGHSEIVKLLLDAGANVNALGISKETALMYAAQSGQAEVVKQLLTAGADVNIENSDGRTALSMSHNKEITTLLKAEKDTIMDACDRRDIAAVKSFIKSGVDVNALTKREIMVGGVDMVSGMTWDGFEIWEESPLHRMVLKKADVEKDILDLKHMLEREHYYSLTDEQIKANLTKATQKHKEIGEIIKLLQSAGAKDIWRKIS